MPDPIHHRCCSKLRGFAAGPCEHRATIEHEGRWYCGKHDPRPVVPSGEPQYVWEVWTHSLFSRPHVTRYRLVKMHAKGGATVLKYGYPHVLKPASDKKHLTSLEHVHNYLATWHTKALDRARREVESLERAAVDPLRGIVIEEVRDEPHRPAKLKLD